MKILIADDEAITQMSLKLILSEFGSCDAASNGIEAIELFNKSLDDKKQYDIVFLDIKMPSIDGLTVLKKIRDIEQNSGAISFL